MAIEQFEFPNDWLLDWKQAPELERIIRLNSLLKLCIVLKPLDYKEMRDAGNFLTGKLQELENLGCPFVIEDWQIKIVKIRIGLKNYNIFNPMYIPDWMNSTRKKHNDPKLCTLGVCFDLDREVEIFWHLEKFFPIFRKKEYKRPKAELLKLIQIGFDRAEMLNLSPFDRQTMILVNNLPTSESF